MEQRGVEDTYKYLKQEFCLEEVILKKYKSLQNMMIFLLASMNFVTKLRKNEEKYFCQELEKVSRSLNQAKLKYKEHSIISGIREILKLSTKGIRKFIQKQIAKITQGMEYNLFGKIHHDYEILGKL